MKFHDILYTEIKEQGWERILRLKNNEQEENNNLEFKLIYDFKDKGLSSDVKKNFAKSSSAFSNASGGLVIWGIDCRKGKDGIDCVKEIKPITNIRGFFNEMKGEINNVVEPINPGIEHHMVLSDNDSNKGVLVTYIPESDLSPIRAMFRDNRYYIRTGESSQLVPHNMLRQMFAAKQKPKAEIFLKMKSNGTIGGKTGIAVTVGIENTGQTLLKYPAIRIIPKNGLQIDKHRKTGLPIKITGTEGSSLGCFYVGGIDHVVYPNSYLPIIDLENEVEPKILNDEHLDTELFKFKYEIYGEDFSTQEGNISLTISDYIKDTAF
ncbi:ATP-binding protein [Priestia filamentosa]|uniref:AlbA family DNA-binding domain-containing protein n=1 Tax=Priestia filamentosa TaxID=1402861 RepID=UPI00397C9F27